MFSDLVFALDLNTPDFKGPSGCREVSSHFRKVGKADWRAARLIGVERFPESPICFGSQVAK